MLPIRTVLHPTDFSDSSGHAFRVACSLARDYGARLVAVHVAPPPVIAYGDGVFPGRAVVYEEEARDKLDKLQAPDPKVHVEPRLVEGDAAGEILRAAEETQCDVIVMGTHGRTGLGRLLMGSVAEQVLRKAPCLVLTVRTPFPAEGSSPESVQQTAGRLVRTKRR
jgi:nucleotide-binding universal stress UspA family protein